MYEINIFDEINMPLDWLMVYYGISSNILRLDIAQDFACRKLEHDELLSEDELELAWNVTNRLDILELIRKILGNQEIRKDSLEQAKEKILLAVIIHLREKEKNISTLLEKIDVVYADFDYPQKMESFVSYMPVEDDSSAANYTIEDRKKILLLRLDDFIAEQMNKYHIEKTL